MPVQERFTKASRPLRGWPKATLDRHSIRDSLLTKTQWRKERHCVFLLVKKGKGV